jgi:hypothetical protein
MAASVIPRQLPPSPRVILAGRVKDPFDVPVQRSHDADPRKHRWPVMFGN